MHALDARDQSFLLIEYIAFDQTYGSTGTKHSCFGWELRVPNGAQEIDLQFDGRECRDLLESAAVSDPHSRVCDIAQHSTMKGPHGICMAISCFKFDRGSPNRISDERKIQQGANRRRNSSRIPSARVVCLPSK